MPTLSFHTSNDGLIKQIEARTKQGESRSEVIESALGYYFLLLADARRSLKAALTGEELYLICDALNGTFIDEFSVKYIRHEIVDACELNGLDAKWKVDKHALDKKFAHMTLTELVALADAVRRFWQRVSAGENDKSPSEMGILD